MDDLFEGDFLYSGICVYILMEVIDLLNSVLMICGFMLICWNCMLIVLWFSECMLIDFVFWVILEEFGEWGWFEFVVVMFLFGVWLIDVVVNEVILYLGDYGWVVFLVMSC